MSKSAAVIQVEPSQGCISDQQVGQAKAWSPSFSLGFAPGFPHSHSVLADQWIGSFSSVIILVGLGLVFFPAVHKIHESGMGSVYPFRFILVSLKSVCGFRVGFVHQFADFVGYFVGCFHVFGVLGLG